MVFLAKHPLIDKYNLSSLNAIYSGAAPLSLDIQHEIAKRIGKNKSLTILQGYGMTESCVLATLHDEDKDLPINNSVGKLLRGMSAKVSLV
jgi:4-coumarate--CoA ligase